MMCPYTISYSNLIVLKILSYVKIKIIEINLLIKNHCPFIIFTNDNIIKSLTIALLSSSLFLYLINRIKYESIVPYLIL